MWNQRKWAPPLFRSAASAVLTVLCVLATRSPAMGVGERFVGPPRVWTVSDLQDLSTDVVQVKFVEGSNVSLRNGRFEDDSGLDLSRLYAVLEGRRDAVLSVHPTFPEDRQVLRDWQRKGEEACACVGPDLSLWFDLKITGGAGAVVQLVNELEELPCVEIAHPAPCPRPASESATPGLLGAPTSPRERAPEHSSPGGTQQGSTSGAPIPDLTPLQGYLYEPPFGLNATALHTYPGGFGEGQRLIDFELYVSVPDHVEFDPSKLFYVGEVVEARSEHMTKSLGSILGIHDSEGIDGIAPAVEYGIENLDAQDDFGAQCLKAIAPLQQGDVWLIEVDLNGGPFERLQSVYDVIWTATMGRGIVCVEPAGNGAHDLDDPVYGGVFDREVRDSGAILCAAGFADALDRVPVSSWGSRVDVHAWGENVVTTGGGDLYDGGTPQTEYTGSFCCTSSASSLIAGGVTALQGVARMAFGAPLDPISLRRVLHETGTPHESEQEIGPRADFGAAAAAIVAGTAGAGSGDPPKSGIVAAPTPFHGRTRLLLQGPTPPELRVELFDASGRRVRTWPRLDSADAPLDWDGSDGSGQPLPAGVYLVRATARDGVRQTRVTRLR